MNYYVLLKVDSRPEVWRIWALDRANAAKIAQDEYDALQKAGNLPHVEYIHIAGMNAENDPFRNSAFPVRNFDKTEVVYERSQN